MQQLRAKASSPWSLATTNLPLGRYRRSSDRNISRLKRIGIRSEGEMKNGKTLYLTRNQARRVLKSNQFLSPPSQFRGHSERFAVMVNATPSLPNEPVSLSTTFLPSPNLKIIARAKLDFEGHVRTLCSIMFSNKRKGGPRIRRKERSTNNALTLGPE